LFEDQYNDEKVGILVNTADPLNQLLEAEAVDLTEGNQFIFFHTLGLGDSDRDFSENDDLAEPDATTDEQAKYNMTWYNFTIRCSGQVIVNQGAATKVLSHQIMAKKAAMRLYFEKSPFIKSTGELAAIYSTPASATSIVVDNELLVDVGMKVDVVVATTGAVTNGVSGATITAKTGASNGTATLTLDTPLAVFASVDTTYIVVRSGSWNKAPFSLIDIVSASNPDGGNFGQINRSTAANELWRANEHDVENKAISSLQIATAIGITENKSGISPNRVILNDYVWRDLMNQAVSDRRIENSTKNMEVWGTTLTVDGVPIYKFRFCPYSKGFVWNSDVIKPVHPTGMPRGGMWIRPKNENGQDTGGPLQQDKGKWSYKAAYVVGRQRVSSAPNATTLMKNIGWSKTGMAV
jgi:hypothetical protein